MGLVNDLIQQRCPACRQGAVFRTGLQVNQNCPVCGLRLMREQGYFIGAMYISYFVAVPILAFLVWILSRWTSWSLPWRLVLATLLFSSLIRPIVRYSRLLWIYWDQAVDPSH